MGEVPKITDLAKVIEPHLPAGATLESYTSRYLTKPGENYGSIMLAVQAKVRDANGAVKELPLIAKLPPLTNDLYWQIFQPERTCVTENAVYKFLSPELDKLQLQAGIPPNKLFDGFPRYYGSRISLDASATKVDRDAVLVQENATTRGYQPGNRHKAYDLGQTVLILHYLARYHALPLALRLKKPQVYDELVRPYFLKFDMNTNIAPEEKATMDSEVLKDIRAVATEEKDVERVKELLGLYDDFQAGKDEEDGPFTSLVHGDLWINNMMLKYGEFQSFLISEISEISIYAPLRRRRHSDRRENRRFPDCTTRLPGARRHLPAVLQCGREGSGGELLQLPQHLLQGLRPESEGRRRGHQWLQL